MGVQIDISGCPPLSDPAAQELLQIRIATALRRQFGEAAFQAGEPVFRLNPARPALPTPDRAGPGWSAAGQGPSATAPGAGDELSLEERARQYQAVQPRWNFGRLILSGAVREEIAQALAAIEHQERVFQVWGLGDIEPFPRSILNFHGAPGTGKTAAAHAVAHALGRPFIEASYARIESKFHGEGPKNLEALFHAARRDGAVLFVDEADSLLSKRIAHVTQGAEQAINSLRSQLLINLERFTGVVIFATNLVGQYDPAFETRVRSVAFPLPDEAARTAIWQAHLVPGLPRAGDVDPADLARRFPAFCGRDIKNAVVDAAISLARRGGAALSHADLIAAGERLQASLINQHQDGPKASSAVGAATARKIRHHLRHRPGPGRHARP